MRTCLPRVTIPLRLPWSPNDHFTPQVRFLPQIFDTCPFPTRHVNPLCFNVVH
ncbi:uncharacterized protein G2W53_034221 [Senna tora]|uniref:Uncharacterized protein n=1 Tax=Senna tora TaxID=362788 RepID=A0A834W7K7_9FABA|nr:uncharacterized protein G2W53_034221 [Senna tora]